MLVSATQNKQDSNGSSGLDGMLEILRMASDAQPVPPLYSTCWKGGSCFESHASAGRVLFLLFKVLKLFTGLIEAACSD